MSWFVWRAWHIVGAQFRHLELLAGWINGLKNKKPFGFTDVSVYKCGLVIVFRRSALMKRGTNLYCKYCLVLKGRLTIARFIISWGNAFLEVSPALETCLTQVKSAQLSGASEITHSQGTVSSTGLRPPLCTPGPLTWTHFWKQPGQGPRSCGCSRLLSSVSPGVSLSSGKLLHCYAISPSIVYWWQ